MDHPEPQAVDASNRDNPKTGTIPGQYRDNITVGLSQTDRTEPHVEPQAVDASSSASVGMSHAMALEHVRSLALLSGVALGLLDGAARGCRVYYKVSGFQGVRSGGGACAGGRRARHAGQRAGL